MILNKNIIKYRKHLKKTYSNYLNINKKYQLICDFNGFNGLGLKLLKLYFIKYKLSLNLYKNLVIYNYKMSNFISFQFSKFKSILFFIKFMQNLTLIPFFFYPLYIINKKKNIIMPLNYVNLKDLNNLNKKNFINLILIKVIKNLIILILLKITKKLTKCQL